MNSLTRRIIIAVIILGLLAGVITFLRKEAGGEPASFRTDSLKKGDLVVAISATGVVQPEEVIDIGAQVAGRIIGFGKDRKGKTIDYISEVEKGMVLAKIDDSLYAADAAQAAAQLKQAKASLQRAVADLLQIKARLYQAQRDWERAQKLGPSEALAETSFDAYRASYETTRASVEIGEAVILQAKASVDQSEAALRKAQQNLSYCTIKSPVSGIIIDRRVNIGQTVVASLNAPSLFLIAKDLKRMQVWVSVNEADIGRIKPGQKANFTVDAFPGEIFNGEVGKIRLNASMSQNVVTYTVEIYTDNSSGKLLPYLTANMKIEISSIKNVMLAPNSALRWKPQPEQIAPEFREASGSGDGKAKGSEDRKKNPEKGSSDSQKQGTLWTKQGKFLQPLIVKTGLSDGTVTEIQGEGIKEGLEVIVGQQAQNTQQGSANPFVPQFGRPTTTR